MAGDVLTVTTTPYIYSKPEFRDSTLIFLINGLMTRSVRQIIKHRFKQ